ncbi:MAG TPA: choice-of-anchor Q domain-containing protein, partial [bacterium]|nr:choice-of-anchor Q domain-containing protein [bacterium]
MQRFNIFGTGTLALALTLISANLQGATFNVSNGSELQTALTTAQSNGEGDTILLAPGTYDASGATFTYVADNSLGSEENFPLTLQGSDAATTLLDGGDANQVMVLDASPIPDDSNADIRIENLTFQNANATTFGAGLLVITNNADVTLLGSQFLNNETTNFGAGADLQLGAHGGSGNLVANGNLFAGNVANDIGAAEFIVDGGSAVISNNIFFNNQSVGNTGAVIVQYFSGVPAGGPMTLVNNTFFQNTSGTDIGALYLAADLSGEVLNVYNNIIFGNSAGTTSQDIFADLGAGAVLNLFNNDFSEICFDAVNCDPALNASVNLGANLNVDPLLVDPTGGDFSLGLGSPVIDQGDPNAPDLPALDYLGNPRIAGAAPDMG